MSDGHSKKICFVMTATSALRAFMADHIRVLAQRYHVTVYCNFATDTCGELFELPVRLVHIPFERRISPWKDLCCLLTLVAMLHKERFDSVHSLMPKTGLLTMLAAWISAVPVRVHMFTGQVWVTRRGLSRALLKSMDCLIARLATDVYADSPSQRQFLVAEGVIRSGQVLGDGSVNGVDVERFVPNPDARRLVRRQLGIEEETLVFGFLGRLNRDKGVFDLIEAFASSGLTDRACLLLVGPDEAGIEDSSRARYPELREQVRFVGFTPLPEEYLAAFDLFCIPSYREGFGSSVIEAAACAVPAMASRIYGLTDAVEEGVTGLMHAPRDIAGIRDGLVRFGDEPEMLDRFGRAARQRALERFSRERLVQEMNAEYTRLLGDGEPRSCRENGEVRGAGDLVRRLVEVIGCSAGLILLMPLLALVGIVVRFNLGSPILFKQYRPGYRKRLFAMYKFRTMGDDQDESGKLLPDEDRLTRVGQILRKTSLDEFPELWNVLRGDMSLVGPRPLLAEYLPLYTARQARRFQVKPGITGWAQVHGRNSVDWEERLEMDVWYVENRSLWLDLKILFLTFYRVVTMEGTSQKGHVTMEKFKGIADDTRKTGGDLPGQE